MLVRPYGSFPSSSEIVSTPSLPQHLGGMNLSFSLSLSLCVSTILCPCYFTRVRMSTDGVLYWIGFIASSWHVTSHGMFAGSCIGVICLVVVLELLRRAQREYNKFVSHVSRESRGASSSTPAKRADSSSGEASPDSGLARTRKVLVGGQLKTARPTLLQQAARATIHMSQFAVAYFIMLLAMYYNGKDLAPALFLDTFSFLPNSRRGTP